MKNVIKIYGILDKYYQNMMLTEYFRFKIKSDVIYQYIFRYTMFDQYLYIIQGLQDRNQKAENFNFIECMNNLQLKPAILRFQFNNEIIIDNNATITLAESFDKYCQMFVISANPKQLKLFIDILVRNLTSQTARLTKACLQVYNNKKEQLTFENFAQLFPPQIFQNLTFMQCNIKFQQGIYNLRQYDNMQTLDLTIDNDNIILQKPIYFSALKSLIIRKMEFTSQELIELLKYCKYVKKIVIHTEKIQLTQIPTNYDQFGDIFIENLSINVIEGLQVIVLSIICKLCKQLQSLSYHGMLLRMSQEEQQQFKTKLFAQENKQKLQEYIQKENLLNFQEAKCYQTQDDDQNSDNIRCITLDEYDQLQKSKTTNSINNLSKSICQSQSIHQNPNMDQSDDSQEQISISQTEARQPFNYLKKNSLTQGQQSSKGFMDMTMQNQNQINYDQSTSDDSSSLFENYDSELDFSQNSEERQEKQALEVQERKNEEINANNRRNSNTFNTLLQIMNRTSKTSTRSNNEEYITNILDNNSRNIQIDNGTTGSNESNISNIPIDLQENKLQSSQTYQHQNNTGFRKDLTQLFSDMKGIVPKMQKPDKIPLVDDVKRLPQQQTENKSIRQHLRVGSLFKTQVQKVFDDEDCEKDFKVLTKLKDDLLSSTIVRSKSNPIIIVQNKYEQLNQMSHVITKQQEIIRDKCINVHFRNTLRSKIAKRMDTFYTRRQEKSLRYKLQQIQQKRSYTQEQLRYLNYKGINDIYYNQLQTYNCWQSNFECEFNYRIDKGLQTNLHQIPKVVQYFNNLELLNFNESDEIFYKPVNLQIEHKLELACNYQLNEDQMNNKIHKCSSTMQFSTNEEKLIQSVQYSEFNIQENENPLFPKQWNNSQENKLYIQQNTFSLSHVLILSLPQTITRLNIQNTSLTKLDHILLSQLQNLQSLMCSSIDLHENTQYMLPKLEKLEITNGGLLDIKTLSIIAPNLKILVASNVMFIHCSDIKKMNLIKLSVKNSPNLLSSQLHQVIKSSQDSLRYIILKNTVLPQLDQIDYFPNVYQIICNNIVIHGNSIYIAFDQLFQLIKQTNVQVFSAKFKEQIFDQQSIVYQQQHRNINYSKKIGVKIYVPSNIYELLKNSGQYQQEFDLDIIQLIK